MAFNFETILQAHDQPVRAMSWSNDGHWLATGDQSGYIKYWQQNMCNCCMYQVSFSNYKLRLSTFRLLLKGHKKNDWIEKSQIILRRIKISLVVESVLRRRIKNSRLAQTTVLWECGIFTLEAKRESCVAMDQTSNRSTGIQVKELLLLEVKIYSHLSNYGILKERVLKNRVRSIWGLHFSIRQCLIFDWLKYFIINRVLPG